TWFRLNSADQKRWDSMKETYRKAKEQDSRKTTQGHLKEIFTSPFYFAKGVAEGALKLLERGGSPILHGGSEGLLFLQNPKAYLEDKMEDQKVLQSKIRTTLLHPGEFLHQLSEGTKDQITEKAAHFLSEDEAQRSETVGKFAPGLALSFLGGGGFK